MSTTTETVSAKKAGRPRTFDHEKAQELFIGHTSRGIRSSRAHMLVAIEMGVEVKAMEVALRRFAKKRATRNKSGNN